MILRTQKSEQKHSRKIGNYDTSLPRCLTAFIATNHDSCQSYCIGTYSAVPSTEYRHWPLVLGCISEGPPYRFLSILIVSYRSVTWDYCIIVSSYRIIVSYHNSYLTSFNSNYLIDTHPAILLEYSSITSSVVPTSLLSPHPPISHPFNP